MEQIIYAETFEIEEKFEMNGRKFAKGKSKGLSFEYIEILPEQNKFRILNETDKEIIKKLSEQI